MAAYTISPTDLTRPLATDEAQYMADEIRALKSYIATQLAAVGAPLPAWGIETKNLFINGDFKVWQRATVGSTRGAIVADRWKCNSSGTGVYTVSQVAGYTSKYAINIADTVLTTAQYLELSTALEAIDSSPYAGQVCTVSFWATAPSGDGTLVCDHGYPSAVDNFAVVEYPYTVASQAVNNTWQKYTFTLTHGNSASGYNPKNGLLSRIRYVPNVNGSRSITISDVQFEFGTGSSFELLPYTQQFARCQRFYQQYLGLYAGIHRGYNGIAGASQYWWWVPFQVTMRLATPAVSKVGTWAVANCSQPIVGGAHAHGVYLNTTATAQGVYHAYPNNAAYGFTANAELTW